MTFDTKMCEKSKSTTFSYYKLSSKSTIDSWLSIYQTKPKSIQIDQCQPWLKLIGSEKSFVCALQFLLRNFSTFWITVILQVCQQENKNEYNDQAIWELSVCLISAVVWNLYSVESSPKELFLSFPNYTWYIFCVLVWIWMFYSKYLGGALYL